MYPAPNEIRTELLWSQNNGDTLSKEVKLNAGDAALGVSSTRGTSDPAGRKISNFGYKAAGKTVQVHDGDTLWGLAMKHNVRSLPNLSFLMGFN